MSADFGDINGNGLPDVVMLVPKGPTAGQTRLHLFFNRDGRFGNEPDQVIPLPQLQSASKVLLGHLTDDGQADFLVSGGADGQGLLVVSTAGPGNYRMVTIPGLQEAHHWLTADLNGNSRRDALIGQAFGGGLLALQQEDGSFETTAFPWKIQGPYVRPHLADVNGDKRMDLVLSSGQIFLRRENGDFPTEPDITLSPPDKATWTFGTVGDFNGDGRPDVALASFEQPKLDIYYNTGNAAAPFGKDADAEFDLTAAFQGPRQRKNFNRTGPEVADYDTDGVSALLVSFGQDTQIVVLLGGEAGLDVKRAWVIPLDCRLHYQMRIGAADFTRDGKKDLAIFGYNRDAGVGNTGGPTAVFIRRNINTRQY